MLPLIHESSTTLLPTKRNEFQPYAMQPKYNGIDLEAATTGDSGPRPCQSEVQTILRA